MVINKHIQRKVDLEFFFAQGKIDINCKSLINKIKKGFKAENNLNYKTNVKDKMTSFDYFKNDKEFLNILAPMIKYVDTYANFPKYLLKDAWGFQSSTGAETIKHDHRGNEWSGVLYLNDHEQTLDFNEINIKIKPEPGGFALFSSFLSHEAKQHSFSNTKFGISFNLMAIPFQV
jgi:hypothetical protein